MTASDLDRLRIRLAIPKRFAFGRESGSLLSGFSNELHILSRLEKSMVFSTDAIFGKLGPKGLVILHF